MNIVHFYVMLIIWCVISAIGIMTIVWNKSKRVQKLTILFISLFNGLVGFMAAHWLL